MCVSCFELIFGNAIQIQFSKMSKNCSQILFFFQFPLSLFENLRNTLSLETKNENAQLRMKTKKKKLVFGKDTNKSVFPYLPLGF